MQLDIDQLLAMAGEAFDAIETNAGERLWTASDDKDASLRAAFEAFRNITADRRRGIAWLIDNTTGSGMTHMGWTSWMLAARRILGIETKETGDPE